MEESFAPNSYDVQRLVGIVIPVLLLGYLASISPIAILQNNVVPPYYPPPPGWTSSVTIYVWLAFFDGPYFQEVYGLGGGVTNLHTSPFLIITLIYAVIQIAVSMRKMPAKYGVVSEIVLFLIWVTVCQMIYGTLQDWTLNQTPVFPIVGVSFLLVGYGMQRRG